MQSFILGLRDLFVLTLFSVIGERQQEARLADWDVGCPLRALRGRRRGRGRRRRATEDSGRESAEEPGE